MIEVKPATVIINSVTVASYDTVPSAIAFRQGVEWATNGNRASAIVEAVIDELCSRSGLDNAWNEIDDATQHEIRAACAKAVIGEMRT